MVCDLYLCVQRTSLCMCRFATSAKDSIGIDEASRHLVSKILENHDSDTAEAPKGSDVVKIEKEKQSGNSSDGGCCA
jgi:hypothetical protein